MMETMLINNIEYHIECLLGHGKGGYSYLATSNNQKYVLKKIHHEPCSYYQFGNKMESELRDYDILYKSGIRIPKMIDYDLNQEVIVKEYIEGETIDKLILNNQMDEKYLHQVQNMCNILYPLNLNIDYFPTNFVVCNDILYYIDYECNKYSQEWNFENWGIKYWSKTKEFQEHFKNK